MSRASSAASQSFHAVMPQSYSHMTHEQIICLQYVVCVPDSIHLVLAKTHDRHSPCRALTLMWPSQVECPGRCQHEIFCSPACAQTAWESHHRLLCDGGSQTARSSHTCYLPVSVFHEHDGCITWLAMLSATGTAGPAGSRHGNMLELV